MPDSENVRFYDLSEKDDWQTPPELVNAIRLGLHGIDIDPCAHEDTEYGDVNLRLEDGDDGLEDDWVAEANVANPTAFVNPPFSYKKEWLQKVVEQIDHGVQCAVVITPDVTDTISIWHEYIAPHAEYVCFHEGRVKYYDDGEEIGSPPFGTAISVFGDAPYSLVTVLQEYGHVMQTVER